MKTLLIISIVILGFPAVQSVCGLQPRCPAVPDEVWLGDGNPGMETARPRRVGRSKVLQDEGLDLSPPQEEFRKSSGVRVYPATIGTGALGGRHVQDGCQEEGSEVFFEPLSEKRKNRNGAGDKPLGRMAGQSPLPPGGEFPVISEGESHSAEEKTAEGKDAGKRVDESSLRAAVAGTRRELADIQKKIEADHELWSEVEKEIEKSRLRLSELEAALNSQRTNLNKLRKKRTRIEQEHDGDHDREKELVDQLSRREKALAEFERKQHEIRKLSKKAEELRRRAEELREE